MQRIVVCNGDSTSFIHLTLNERISSKECHVFVEPHQLASGSLSRRDDRRCSFTALPTLNAA
jgi:hypothetical protein